MTSRISLARRLDGAIEPALTAPLAPLVTANGRGGAQVMADRMPAGGAAVGMAAVGMAAACWALGAVVASELFRSGVDAVDLVGVRTYLAAAGLFPLALLAHRPELRPVPAPGASLVAYGMSIAVANGAYFLAIERLPVAVAIVLQNLAPAIVIVWVALRRARLPSLPVRLALVGVTVGVVLVTQLPHAQLGAVSFSGVLFGLVTACAIAVFSVLGERVTRVHGPTRATAWAFGVASVFWLSVQVTRGWPTTVAHVSLWPKIVFVGLVGTLLPFLLFSVGVRRAQAERAAMAVSLEPVVGAIVAWVWLGQALSAMQLLGGAVTIGAVATLRSGEPVMGLLPDTMGLERHPSGSGVGPTASSSTSRRQVDVRDTMRRLPSFLQLLLTFMTGKPYAGQPPLRLVPTLHLVAALASLVLGLGASGVALSVSGWWLLLLVPGWAMTLHGMRNLRMMIYHQCAHQNMWCVRRADELLGRLIAGLLMVQSFERYRAEHTHEHHASHHMSLRDPTVQALLVSLELRVAMTRRQMWRRLLGKLWSPAFHLRFGAARVRSYFHGATPTTKAVTTASYVAAAVVVSMRDGWLFVLVGWLLPLTLFFQVSTALRLCVKHTFPAPEVTERRGKEYFASLTTAVFMGEPVPDRDLSPPHRTVAWARWWLRMLCVHFPSRYLVVTGDSVCHDYHHRHPLSRDWANYIFARQHDVDSGHRGWPPYREVWGLVPAINVVFDSLSVAAPTSYDAALIPEVSKREVFAAFDD